MFLLFNIKSCTSTQNSKNTLIDVLQILCLIPPSQQPQFHIKPIKLLPLQIRSVTLNLCFSVLIQYHTQTSINLTLKPSSYLTHPYNTSKAHQQQLIFKISTCLLQLLIMFIQIFHMSTSRSSIPGSNKHQQLPQDFFPSVPKAQIPHNRNQNASLLHLHVKKEERAHKQALCTGGSGSQCLNKMRKYIIIIIDDKAKQREFFMQGQRMHHLSITPAQFLSRWMLTHFLYTLYQEVVQEQEHMPSLQRNLQQDSISQQSYRSRSPRRPSATNTAFDNPSNPSAKKNNIYPHATLPPAQLLPLCTQLYLLHECPRFGARLRSQLLLSCPIHIYPLSLMLYILTATTTHSKNATPPPVLPPPQQVSSAMNNRIITYKRLIASTSAEEQVQSLLFIVSSIYQRLIHLLLRKAHLHQPLYLPLIHLRIGVLRHPLFCVLVEFLSVLLVLASHNGVLRIVGLGHAQQGLQGQQGGTNGQRGRPLVLEDIEADGPGY